MSHISDPSVSSIHDYNQIFWQVHQIDVLNLTLHYIRRHSMTDCPTVGYGTYGHLVKVLIIRSLYCRRIATGFCFFPCSFLFKTINFYITFGLTAKLREKYKDFLYICCPHTGIAIPYKHPSQGGALLELMKLH